MVKRCRAEGSFSTTEGAFSTAEDTGFHRETQGIRHKFGEDMEWECLVDCFVFLMFSPSQGVAAAALT